MIPALPRWAWGAILIAAGILAFIVWDIFDDKAAVSADRGESKAVVTGRARKADETAHGAAQGKIKQVEQSNEQAREAADGSDDPLKSAFDELRAEKDRNGSASRKPS